MSRYHQQGTGAELETVQKVLMEATTFTCSICGEGSREICVFCTKDACANHLCERCHRCSDCCECDMPLTRGEDAQVESVTSTAAEPAFVPNGVGELTSS